MECKDFDNECGEGDDKGEWDKELDGGILSCGLGSEDLRGVRVVGEKGSDKEQRGENRKNDSHLDVNVVR